MATTLRARPRNTRLATWPIAHRSLLQPLRENIHSQKEYKVSFQTTPSAKSRDNSFSKGWRKTRSLFQGEALSGLLRYYLDVSAASGQPQFGEKRTICCEERDFIELKTGSEKRPSASVHVERNFLWSKTLHDTTQVFIFIQFNIVERFVSDNSRHLPSFCSGFCCCTEVIILP